MVVETDAVASARHATSFEVDHQVTAPDRAAGLGVGQLAIRPPQQRLDAADQLAHAERLHQVVVGAHFQPDHLVHLVRAGGEEDHRSARLASQLAQDLEAIDPGEADVEHDEVGRGVGEVRDRVLAGRLHADVVPLSLEGDLDAAGHGGLVLHDHDRAGHARSIGTITTQSVTTA